MNEGGCDPDGRFYCGSMAYDQQRGRRRAVPARPRRQRSRRPDGVTVSNGLEWSPDGTLAYYNDTATYTIDVFDYDRDAGLTDRRVFADARAPTRRADRRRGGRSLGGAVRRRRGAPLHAGRRAGRGISCRPAKVTACTFGGADLDELFITTSREGLEPGDDPLAGSLFRAVPGVRGLPVAGVRRLMIASLVLFGASGDLAGRYLLPALAALRAAGPAAGASSVVGAARERWDDEAFRRHAAERLAEHADGHAATSARPSWPGRCATTRLT